MCILFVLNIAHNYDNKYLQVVVSYAKKPKYFHLTRSLKKLGRFVGRGSKQSIARAAVNNKSLLPQLVCALCSAIRKELKSLCSDKHDSILRLKSKPALENFTWKTVWLELEQNAPTFLALLVGLLPASKHQLDSVRPALCMCASILLKLTNQKMDLVQTVVSLVLKAGHATKQVGL